MQDINGTWFRSPSAEVTYGELTAEVYDAASDIDLAAWSSLVDDADWSMDPAVIAVQQSSLADQARIWCVVMRDRSGCCHGCAALALFRTDIVQAAPKLLKTTTDSVRRFWPSALRMGILFCGLPIPDGGNHLRIAKSADTDAVLFCLDRIMQHLARRHGARLLVVKEFDRSEMQTLSSLGTLGYITGEVPPMHRLTRTFSSFEDYCRALRSNYRHQIEISLAKLAASGVTMRHYHDPGEIAQRFTDDLHQLYLNVLHRNDKRLEKLPAAFFRDLPKALPDRFHLTVIEERNRPLAFAFGIDTDGCYHNLYIGVDYRANKRADLYFNAFYQPMREAFARGVAEIKLGATSGDFKSRLGAVASSTHFFARTASHTVQPLFKAASGLLFPAIQREPVRNVFKQDNLQGGADAPP